MLEGLVKGLANKQIAFAHGISPRTVEIYRANLMTKMQAASVSDLVRMALVAGMLDRHLVFDDVLQYGGRAALERIAVAASAC